MQAGLRRILTGVDPCLQREGTRVLPVSRIKVGRRQLQRDWPRRSCVRIVKVLK
jgi:hypothetical protein